jgi:hypothetical protein
MNSMRYPLDTRARRPRQLTLLVGASLYVLLGATGGCQGRGNALSAPARILRDSLLAGNEAMYDSASANLGFDRLGCLEERAAVQLGLGLVERLGREAEDTVRARHSRAALEAGRRGIEMIHPVADSAFCKRIDSLWYARLAKPPGARPQP